MGLSALFVIIVITHPIWLTVIVAILLGILLSRTTWWRGHKRLIVLILVVLYAADTAIALPRIIYAWRTPKGSVIHQQVPTPKQVVLVNARCLKECHDRLLSGQIEELIRVKTDPRQPETKPQARLYRAGWSQPGECPRERLLAIDLSAREQLPAGFCPLITAAEIPSEGLFVVQESFGVTASQKAARFKPKFLTDDPPGRMIKFRGIEVQRRTEGQVEVMASERYYVAPGLVGLPPLVGCWERPDNIIWIMPPGDTGCGLWRWFTEGGAHQSTDAVDWVFSDVLLPNEPDPARAPDRPAQ